MDDPQIHGRIEQLVADEHELWNGKPPARPRTPTDHAYSSCTAPDA